MNIVRGDLGESSVNQLETAFIPFRDQVVEWKKGVEKAPNVTGVEQVEEMKKCGDLRKSGKKMRVAIEKTRKEVKADALKFGKAVDATAKMLKDVIEPLEKELEKREKFAEYVEKERVQKLHNARLDIAADYSEYIPLNSDFGNMTENMFNNMVNGAKLQKQADEKAEAERKEMEEKEAREEAERQRKIQEENKRLRAEAEQLEREREEALEKERKHKEEIEEMRRKDEEREAEIAREMAKAKERERIAQESHDENVRLEKEKHASLISGYTSTDKILSLREEINNIEIPDVDGIDENVLVNSVQQLLDKVVDYIDNKLANINGEE